MHLISSSSSFFLKKGCFEFGIQFLHRETGNNCFCVRFAVLSLVEEIEQKTRCWKEDTDDTAIPEQ